MDNHNILLVLKGLEEKTCQKHLHRLCVQNKIVSSKHVSM